MFYLGWHRVPEHDLGYPRKKRKKQSSEEFRFFYMIRYTADYLEMSSPKEWLVSTIGMG